MMKRLLAALLSAWLLFSSAIAEQPQSPWVNLGEGDGEATLVVVFPDLTTKDYHIRSNRPTLLEALLELELVTVQETESGVVLTMVDGCALPEDQPDAYWFITAYDPQLDSLAPATLPLDQLPLAGQTYAFGMINGESIHE